MWLNLGLRSRRAPCRSVAEEGSAQFFVAVPARRQPTDDGGKAKFMSRVFIGVDPHKPSATIEVVDEAETVLATGRFGTDNAPSLGPPGSVIVVLVCGAVRGRPSAGPRSPCHDTCAGPRPRHNSQPVDGPSEPKFRWGVRCFGSDRDASNSGGTAHARRRSRYDAEGDAGLRDRSSRPRSSPNATPAALAAQVLTRRDTERVGRDEVARRTGVPFRTVSRSWPATTARR